MNPDSAGSNPSLDAWAAFQKIWTDALSKMMSMGFATGSESAPPEFLKQMRSSVFQALAQSWDEFLRSPQFLDSMKQWMEQAVSFRKLTNDFLNRARHETQGTSREDVDATLLALRKMEDRILTRMEELSARLDSLEKGSKPPAREPDSPPRKPKSPSRPRPGRGKTQSRRKTP